MLDIDQALVSFRPLQQQPLQVVPRSRGSSTKRAGSRNTSTRNQGVRRHSSLGMTYTRSLMCGEVTVEDLSCIGSPVRLENVIAKADA